MKFNNGSSEAFASAARISAMSSSRPEFSSVRVDVSEGRALLTAVSDGVWFSTSVPVMEASEDVSFSVPAQLAAEAFRQVPEEGAVVEVLDDAVKVSSGRARYRMRRTSVADQIRFPESENLLELSRERSVLFDDLLACAPAAARDSSMAQLAGVRVEIGADGFSSVATDSFRLATATRDASADAALVDRGFMLPARELTLLTKLFGRSGAITVSVPRDGSAWMRFSDGVSQLQIASLEGQFPQWRKLVSTPPATEVSVDPVEFAELVGRLAPYGASVSLTLEPGVLSLSASGDDGEMSASLPAVTPEDFSGPLSATFQRAFLADALRSMPDGELRLLLGGERSPLWFVCDGRTHLVMPRTSA